MLTISLFVSCASAEEGNVGTMDAPGLTAVTLLTAPLVEVGIESDCTSDAPLTEVEAELTDREGPPVEGAGSDIVDDTAADSGFEPVAAMMLLELRSSVKDLVVNVISTTVDDVVGSKLVT